MPTLPPRSEFVPSLIHISCSKLTVVVLPLEPVNASIGDFVNQEANSISLNIGIFTDLHS